MRVATWRPRGAAAVAPAAPSQTLRIAHARLRDLLALARLQRRGFLVDRGYGLLTCFSLWCSPRTVMLVARDARGEAAGMVIGDMRGGTLPYGRIVNLCVAPEYRRRGYGRLLLQSAEALLPAQRLVLMVDQTNAPAIALYESSGYRRVGLETDYYGRGRHGLVMQKGRSA